MMRTSFATKPPSGVHAAQSEGAFVANDVRIIGQALDEKRNGRLRRDSERTERKAGDVTAVLVGMVRCNLEQGWHCRGRIGSERGQPVSADSSDFARRVSEMQPVMPRPRNECSQFLLHG